MDISNPDHATAHYALAAGGRYKLPVRIPKFIRKTSRYVPYLPALANPNSDGDEKTPHRFRVLTVRLEFTVEFRPLDIATATADVVFCTDGRGMEAIFSACQLVDAAFKDMHPTGWIGVDMWPIIGSSEVDRVKSVLFTHSVLFYKDAVSGKIIDVGKVIKTEEEAAAYQPRIYWHAMEIQETNSKS